jgi:hypothetical protein
MKFSGYNSWPVPCPIAVPETEAFPIPMGHRHVESLSHNFEAYPTCPNNMFSDLSLSLMSQRPPRLPGEGAESVLLIVGVLALKPWTSKGRDRGIPT